MTRRPLSNEVTVVFIMASIYSRNALHVRQGNRVADALGNQDWERGRLVMDRRSERAAGPRLGGKPNSGAAGSPTATGFASVASSRQQLVYMADLIQELQTLADKSGCVTLARILDLAHVEAVAEAARR